MNLEELEKKIEELQRELDSLKAERERVLFVFDLDFQKVLNDVECPIEWETYEDGFANTFTHYRNPIYMRLEGSVIRLSAGPMYGYVEVVPQDVSTYANGIDDDFRIVSKVGATPNLNQLSFNKCGKFAKAMGGEMMRGETALYLMLLCLWKTKSIKPTFPIEEYGWDEKRDCAIRDCPAKYVCGLSQFFDSPVYVFVDIRDLDGMKWEAYKALLSSGDCKGLEEPDGKFATWRMNEDGSSSTWRNGFSVVWYYVVVGTLRLCKARKGKDGI